MHEKPVQSWIAALLILAVLLYAGILLVAPMVTIVSSVFADGIQPVIDALTASDALVALRLTCLLAAGSALVNTVLGVAISWVLVRHQFPGRALFNALVDLPFVMSPVIIGFVIIVLFGREGWFKDLPFKVAFAWPGMLLVTIFVSLPFVIREVMPVLESMTPEEEEAALTLGAGRWRVFRRIILPGIRHGVIYGLVLTLARSLGEFGAAAVAGGGVQGVTETATIYIFRSLHDRNQVGAYSMAVMLGVISVVMLILMNILRNRVAGKGISYVNRAE
jgi:sulfate transport system permease protein